MGPSRKRARTKPPVIDESAATKPVEAATPTTTTQSSSSVAANSSNAPSTKDGTPTRLKTPVNDIKDMESSATDLKSKSSWYGTWPRKSTASTQVARETILADKPSNGQSSADLGRFEPKKCPAIADGRPPSMILGKSKETSDITMGGTLEAEASAKASADEGAKPSDPSSTVGESTAESINGLDGAPAPAPTETQTQHEADLLQRPVTASGWLGAWLGRPAQTPQPTVTTVDPSSDMKTHKQPDAMKQQALDSQAGPSPASIQSEAISIPTSVPPVSTSWFGLWSTAAPSTVEEPKEQIPVKLAGADTDTNMEDVAAPKPEAQPIPGSTWAFWTTDTTKKGVDPTEETKSTGRLAVAGEASQISLEPSKATPMKDGNRGKTAKRGRPQSVEIVESTKKITDLEPPSAKANPPQIPTPAKPAPAKTSPPNLLMPSVRSTYRLVENPSILQQIARLILHGQQLPSKHVFLVKEPAKIRKALAIGIHGLFPAPLLRTVIGQPTGTSIRFANHAAAAIRRWGDQHGCVGCDIEKVALEGEGKIAERVDNLWKLLLNWIDHIRKADFILIGCHSQGVPVALMLVAKLIEFGVVSTSKIGVCAMAGVSLGPFADYKSRLFSGSAGELFEFADPESAVSKRYEDALRIAMKYGVRVTYCGSIDDQLISMESSIFATATHPYIYRAVFVDGRIHAPNFLSHLIGFALKLRNLGVSDHGLIRELSAPLAGSLYTGEGHSRLYDEEKVYDLAVEYTLETTSVPDTPLQIQKYEIPTNANPYVLPWIMRGLLEEDFVKTELHAEVTELLEQFDQWKPATKVLKDVKYRLEAVRSKL